MKVEKIDHIHVYVKDLPRAREIFTAILGGRFSPVAEVNSLSIQSTIHPLGIELIQSTNDHSMVGKAIEKKGEGLAAISLKVPNIEEASSELTGMGLREIGRFTQEGLKEAWFHPRDSFGVLIELCEYNLDHPAAIAMREAPDQQASRQETPLGNFPEKRK